MQYYKDTPQGRVWFSGSLKLKNGSLMATNSKEILEREGWTPFEPQAPKLYIGNDPIPEDVKLKKLFEKRPECKDIVKTISTGIVYHYSTWDVLFKGILSVDNINNGCAVLRAYSVNYMNDALEGLIIPRGISRAEDKSFSGMKSSIKLVDGSEVQCKATESSLYKRRKMLEELNAIQAKQNLFSVSFSKVSDSIPMWNYYGHNGCGLAIGFDANHIVNQGYDLIECIYDKELSNILSEYIYNSCYSISEPEPISVDLSIISKDPHFEYEKECRLPLRKHYGNYCITKRNQFHAIKYDIKRGVISPYVEVLLPIKAIREIWIGPTNDIYLAEDSLKGWLGSIGMSWVKILKSSAPIK